MGLEIVELVMRVEETFEIEIGDEEASGLLSVGNLYTCVLAKLGLTASDRCVSSVTFYRTRRALMGLSGAPRRSIRPSTETERLLPPENRKHNWTHLSQMTGSKLPGLERPLWIQAAIGSISFIMVGWSGVALFDQSLGAPAVWLCSGLGFAWLANRVTVPFATEIPADCRTVHGVTKAILRLNHGIHTEKRQATIGHSWTETGVWDALHALIVDELSVNAEMVLKETQFVRDLNLD